MFNCLCSLKEIAVDLFIGTKRRKGTHKSDICEKHPVQFPQALIKQGQVQ